MRKQRGRPIMAAIFGFLTGLFGVITLMAFGIIPVDSFLVTLLPILLMIVAFALAMWAPIGASRAEPPPSPPMTEYDTL
ncbi:MAG: hypothetical protein QNJ77_15140 [Acidimicrobiia bacterium]|nr:hypothetical protein [Acidimicrobiia bacterium]